MDHSMIRPGLIILGLIAILLVAVRFNLFSRNGVRHMHRYYYGLIMQTFFYVLFLTARTEKFLANAHIAIAIGCIASVAFYILSKRWFHHRFDGESLLMGPRRAKQYILALVFLLLAPFIFNWLKSYFYAAIGASMIAWTLLSALFMVYLWKLEHKLGHPIFEREAQPPRTAN